MTGSWALSCYFLPTRIFSFPRVSRQVSLHAPAYFIMYIRNLHQQKKTFFRKDYNPDLPLQKSVNMCSESVTFDTDPDPHHWVTDPDHALFSSGFQDAKKLKNKFFKNFSLITFCRYIYICIQRQQVMKKSQNCTDQGFHYFDCRRKDPDPYK
jgi:hypothetical protein